MNFATYSEIGIAPCDCELDLGEGRRPSPGGCWVCSSMEKTIKEVKLGEVANCFLLGEIENRTWMGFASESRDRQ